MRIIPKKIKVKNTVWKCYSLPDIIVALVVFAIIFIAITAGNWVIAIITGIAAVVMFMPTSDGIFYTCILENIKFIVSKKKYTKDAVKEKERIDTLIGLKDIKENGTDSFEKKEKVSYNNENFNNWEKDLSSKLSGVKVKFKAVSDDKGKVTLSYSSKEELEEILKCFSLES